MTLTIEATYENGVFVPVQPVDLVNHERVRLTVEHPPGDPQWKTSGGGAITASRSIPSVLKRSLS